MAKQPLTPVVRFAPLGELKVFLITEAELDELENGSPASLYLNFSLFFWGTALSLLVTLLVTMIESTRLFIVFVVFCCGTLIAAVVFSLLWLIQHRSSASLTRRIRDRMPPGPGIQESNELA